MLAACWALAACSTAGPVHSDPGTLQAQVTATETAFARTMADRDFDAFQSFIDEEAIFIEEPAPLKGKAAVAAGWKELYQAAQAPFSWAPERVEVLPSGQLALSTGPVRDPKGRKIGTFSSIWRRDPAGHWRIVFDSGCKVCVECPR